MDASDLALVAEQVREMMTRVAALQTREAIPELSQKLGDVAAQLGSLKDLLAAEPPAPPEVPESEETEALTPSPPPEPGPMSMAAFAAAHAPADGDTRSLIVRLLFGMAASPEDQEAYEEDGSVWKVDWSESLPESGIRPPRPSKPEPGAKPIPKPELWEDLSEGR